MVIATIIEHMLCRFKGAMRAIATALLLLHRYTPVEEEEGNEQDYYGHGHNAPHECLVAFANVASHNTVCQKKMLLVLCL